MGTGYDKQTAQLLAVVGQNMPKMTSEQMQHWINHPKAVAEVLACAFTISKVLCGKRVETLPARRGPFNPERVFRTGSGLYVWDDFRTRIALRAKSVESAYEMQLASFTLTEQATDAQIRAELPEGHVFEDTGIFCCHLAGMIEAQAGGIEGVLLNNSYANIFYVQALVEVFAVSVVWHADARRWSVNASRLRGRNWIADYRVFSAAAAA